MLMAALTVHSPTPPYYVYDTCHACELFGLLRKRIEKASLDWKPHPVDKLLVSRQMCVEAGHRPKTRSALGGPHGRSSSIETNNPRWRDWVKRRITSCCMPTHNPNNLATPRSSLSRSIWLPLEFQLS